MRPNLPVILNRNAETLGQMSDVCAPCDQFLTDSAECRLVKTGGPSFAHIFENKRCRPREYLVSFLRGHLLRRYGAVKAQHAEDIASRIVLALLEEPPSGSFLSNDLNGLRRFLAARAFQGEVDYFRELEGKVRCGNCSYHVLAAEQKRFCGHPDPSHPWRGRVVQASLDPRTFDPPCHQFRSKREKLGGQEEDPDFSADVPTGGDPPDKSLARKEMARLLVECLVSIQRTDPRISVVLLMAHFKDKTNDEIARDLNSTVRTVTRYKKKGLSMLREEMGKRGVRSPIDFDWATA